MRAPTSSNGCGGSGPWSPGLIDHLKRQHRSYDALVFFSLLHATTVHGLPIAPERSILFPHLQLQPALRFGLWPELLPSAARRRATSRRPSAAAARLHARARRTYEEIVGIGIDPPPQQTYPRHQQDPADDVVADDDGRGRGRDDEPDDAYLAGRGIPFRRRHRLYGPFALYGGRVEPDNGCEEMLEYFDSYAAHRRRHRRSC